MNKGLVRKYKIDIWLSEKIQWNLINLVFVLWSFNLLFMCSTLIEWGNLDSQIIPFDCEIRSICWEKENADI